MFHAHKLINNSALQRGHISPQTPLYFRLQGFTSFFWFIFDWNVNPGLFFWKDYIFTSACNSFKTLCRSLRWTVCTVCDRECISAWGTSSKCQLVTKTMKNLWRWSWICEAFSLSGAGVPLPQILLSVKAWAVTRNWQERRINKINKSRDAKWETGLHGL